MGLTHRVVDDSLPGAARDLGAKSHAAIAGLLAEIVRLDRAHHRPVAGGHRGGRAIELTAHTHRSLICDRTRHVLCLQSTLRECFAVALQAFRDLDAARLSRC